jgi:tetraacyldisaccharide 4'-kinase
VTDHGTAAEVGDEPRLISRRTASPVWVGVARAEVAQALCAAHPEVDILVADDGLQHLALARDAQLIVFDERGIGNGQVLPAGPLRQAWPGSVPPRSAVLYNAEQMTTPWPGALARRRLAGAVPLADWHAGAPARTDALQGLRGRRVLAVAGIAAPERFFAMLEAEGLSIDRLPLADHAPLDTLPWPADTPCVLVTEKDAVKLPPQTPNVWVVALDFDLPAETLDALQGWLPPRPPPRCAPASPHP